MRRNPASVSSVAPSLWKTKSRPTSRTSRSIGEGGGTRDGAFDASLAGLKRSGLDRPLIHEGHGSRTAGFSTLTIFVVARPPAAALPLLFGLSSLRMANHPALWRWNWGSLRPNFNPQSFAHASHSSPKGKTYLAAPVHT
jgi:hypothetical protein